MNPNDVIKGFNIFKNKSVGCLKLIMLNLLSHSLLIKEWKDLMQALS